MKLQNLLIVTILLILTAVIMNEVISDPPWMILLPIIAFAGVYVLFRYPFFFILLYFAALVLIRVFVRIRIGPVYITEVIFLILLFRVILSQKLPLLVQIFYRHKNIIIPIILYLIVGLISLFRGLSHGIIALRDSVIVFYSSFVLIVPAYILSYNDIHRFCKYIIYSGFILDILLMINLITNGFGVSEMATPRLFGARTSAFLFLVASLSVSGVFGSRSRTRQMLKYYGISQYAMIILLSGTRNVWIASFISLMFWLMFIKRRSFSAKSVFRYFVFLLIFIIAVISLSRTQYTGESMADSFRRSASSIIDVEQSASATSRLSWWREAFIITLNDNPVFGKPFGSMTLFAEYDPKYNTVMKMAFHNSYVTILYYTGFTGFLLILVVVFRTLRMGVRNSTYSDSDNYRRINTALTLAFLFYCVVSFFNVILEGPQSAMFYWLLIGLLIVLNRNSIRQQLAMNEQ